MTEIEEKFFKIFGIKPKRPCYYSDTHCKNHCNKDCVNFYMKPKYPEITSDILLKLICFNNSHWFKLEDLLCPKNIETIKEDVLIHLLRMDEEYKVVGCKDGFWNEEIRTLFEEGAEDE